MRSRGAAIPEAAARPRGEKRTKRHEPLSRANGGRGTEKIYQKKKTKNEKKRSNRTDRENERGLLDAVSPSSREGVERERESEIKVR